MHCTWFICHGLAPNFMYMYTWHHTQRLFVLCPSLNFLMLVKTTCFLCHIITLVLTFAWTTLLFVFALAPSLGWPSHPAASESLNLSASTRFIFCIFQSSFFFVTFTIRSIYSLHAIVSSLFRETFVTSVLFYLLWNYKVCIYICGIVQYLSGSHPPSK